MRRAKWPTGANPRKHAAGGPRAQAQAPDTTRARPGYLDETARFGLRVACVMAQGRGMKQISLATRFGSLTLTEQNDALIRLNWGDAKDLHMTPLLQEAVRQLIAYDAGRLQDFDLPLRLSGNSLQQAVCRAMQAIPFGQTRTYGEIAADVGASAQAVGQACGGNPLPILIPCHRVMGAGGKLTGFSGAGGVETKVALLRHEGAAGLLI